MKAFHFMDMICRFRQRMRYRLTSTAILMAGVLFMLGAVGFCVASGFLWLSTRVESDVAALTVAGFLFGIGGIVIAFALGRNNDNKPKPIISPNTPESEAEIFSERLVRSALSEVNAAPFKAAFAAIALGVVVGLLRSQKSP